MTLDDALDALRERVQAGRAEGMAKYHKAPRVYLGLANPDVNEVTKAWRNALDVEARVRLAGELWGTDIFEARLAAAKLLTQARIRPDDAAWELIKSWAPDFDSWAIADHACMAGQKRLIRCRTRFWKVACAALAAPGSRPGASGRLCVRLRDPDISL